MAAFELTREPTGIIKAVLHGLWSIEDLNSFTSSLDAIMARSDNGTRRFRILVDGRDHGVQSNAVVAAMQAYLAKRDDRLERTAVIVEKTLHKLQSERVDSSKTQSVFFNEADARDWLALDG